MSKHTPGPWEAYDFEIWAYGERIADTITGVNFEEDRANARLMAAAPELLDALRFYMAQFGQDLEYRGIPYDQYQQEADKTARAAIFKATGETK
jgi:hypothetical protein